MNQKLQAAQDFLRFIAECWNASTGNRATVIFMWIVNVAGALSLIGFTVSFPVGNIPRELSMLIFLIALLIATGWVIQGARVILRKAKTDTAKLHATVEQQASDTAILIAKMEQLKNEATPRHPAPPSVPAHFVTSNNFNRNGTAIEISDDSAARIEWNDFTDNDHGIVFRKGEAQ